MLKFLKPYVEEALPVIWNSFIQPVFLFPPVSDSVNLITVTFEVCCWVYRSSPSFSNFDSRTVISPPAYAAIFLHRLVDCFPSYGHNAVWQIHKRTLQSWQNWDCEVNCENFPILLCLGFSNDFELFGMKPRHICIIFQTSKVSLILKARSFCHWYSTNLPSNLSGCGGSVSERKWNFLCGFLRFIKALASQMAHTTSAFLGERPDALVFMLKSQ